MSTCIRLFLLLLMATALAAGFEAAAWAHGGNFASPGGSVPGAPSSGPPRIGSPRPTITMPSSGTGTASGRLPQSVRWKPADWQVWWQLHLEAFLPLAGEAPTRGVITPSSGPWRMSRPTQRGGRTRHSPLDARVEQGASGIAMPVLLDLIKRGRNTPEPLVAASLIACARCARGRPPIALLRAWALDTKASLEVRESAVLALGLLRRTDAERQLPTSELTSIREFLLRLFGNPDYSMRVRAFSLFSIALLADQPYGEAEIDRDGRWVTHELWQALAKKYPSRELTIALLTALGHQPLRGVPDLVLDGMRQIARGRRVLRRNWDTMERCHALTALARLGGPGCRDILLHTLRNAREHDAVQASALIGLGLHGETMAPFERVATVRTLREQIHLDRHWLVRGLGHIAMGMLLGHDLRAGSDLVLEHTDLLDFLDKEARRGSTTTRAYSALALGLAAWGVTPTTRPIGEAVEQVRKTLCWGMTRARGSDQVIGGYVVGCGLARAESARPILLEILENACRDPALRGHAALALAQLGRGTERIHAALLEATKERVSPFIHLQSVRALTLLDQEGVCEELVRQLRSKRSSRPALASVAASLGRLKDPLAASVLIDLVRDEKASLYVRVASVMALGLTFDPEDRPSRVLLTTHANYPALTWSLAQVFNIL